MNVNWLVDLAIALAAVVAGIFAFGLILFLTLTYLVA